MAGDEFDEVPKTQFTGWWIPADIVLMLQRGEINPREMILLATVDSLVRRGHAGYVGCYASNKFLSKEVGCSEQRIANMIVKLKKQGLIIQTKFDGRRRFIETAWSRTKRRRLTKNGKAGLPKTVRLPYQKR